MLFLRKGLIIRHPLKKKKGVVIDWGTVIDWTVMGARNKKFVISKKELADAVRVWTRRGIEVWPLPEVTFDEMDLPCGKPQGI